ncbi:MAG: HNH endonuclease signature motif containing protein, partial [Lacisediminihabitans sp.]
GSFLLDPDNGRFIASSIDEVLSPRRGGPRFVDPDEKANSETLQRDERTNDQIAADALIDMIRLAVDADPGTVFGRRRPAVRVIVTEEALSARSGHGRLEGHPDPVSFETVERHLCDTGAVAIKFDDDGQCVNVGRDQRLFTERQRVGMGVRDGGCRFPGCDRPPSWCEAHHIDQWQRDNGRTDVADGVLLCRRHHLLLHNNHWQITRCGGYWLQPPKAVDPAQELIPMPGKNPLIETLRQRQREPEPGREREAARAR